MFSCVKVHHVVLQPQTCWFLFFWLISYFCLWYILLYAILNLLLTFVLYPSPPVLRSFFKGCASLSLVGLTFNWSNGKYIQSTDFDRKAVQAQQFTTEHREYPLNYIIWIGNFISSFFLLVHILFNINLLTVFTSIKGSAFFLRVRLTMTIKHPLVGSFSYKSHHSLLLN